MNDAEGDGVIAVIPEGCEDAAIDGEGFQGVAYCMVEGLGLEMRWGSGLDHSPIGFVPVCVTESVYD